MLGSAPTRAKGRTTTRGRRPHRQPRRAPRRDTSRAARRRAPGSAPAGSPAASSAGRSRRRRRRASATLRAAAPASRSPAASSADRGSRGLRRSGSWPGWPSRPAPTQRAAAGEPECRRTAHHSSAVKADAAREPGQLGGDGQRDAVGKGRVEPAIHASRHAELVERDGRVVDRGLEVPATRGRRGSADRRRRRRRWSRRTTPRTSRSSRCPCPRCPAAAARRGGRRRSADRRSRRGTRCGSASSLDCEHVVIRQWAHGGSRFRAGVYRDAGRTSRSSSGVTPDDDRRIRVPAWRAGWCRPPRFRRRRSSTSPVRRRAAPAAPCRCSRRATPKRVSREPGIVVHRHGRAAVRRHVDGE